MASVANGPPSHAFGRRSACSLRVGGMTSLTWQASPQPLWGTSPITKAVCCFPLPVRCSTGVRPPFPSPVLLGARPSEGGAMAWRADEVVRGFSVLAGPALIVSVTVFEAGVLVVAALLAA